MGQRDTQILELVMDGFLDLNVALPWCGVGRRWFL